MKTPVNFIHSAISLFLLILAGPNTVSAEAVFSWHDIRDFGVEGRGFEDTKALFYGTSITHGACASRPGMCHPAILGRRFGRPIINVEYEKLRAEGVTGLYYLEGEKLLGSDNEATVDSSHPADLGFMRQADAFEKVLRTIPGI